MISKIKCDSKLLQFKLHLQSQVNIGLLKLRLTEANSHTTKRITFRYSGMLFTYNFTLHAFLVRLIPVSGVNSRMNSEIRYVECPFDAFQNK